MDLIAEGLKKKLIRFEDGEKYIVYLPQNKRRNYENPEEKVQAETFLKLALIYGYAAQSIFRSNNQKNSLKFCAKIWSVSSNSKLRVRFSPRRQTG